MTAAAYSVSTGTYTVEQLEGEHCAKCGRPFADGEDSRPVRQPVLTLAEEWNLFAHVVCPKGGATR